MKLLYKTESNCAKRLNVKSVNESAVELSLDAVDPVAAEFVAGVLMSVEGRGVVTVGLSISPAKAVMEIARVNVAAAQNCLSCFI
jgi:hypothetical protein